MHYEWFWSLSNSCYVCALPAVHTYVRECVLRARARFVQRALKERFYTSTVSTFVNTLPLRTVKENHSKMSELLLANDCYSLYVNLHTTFLKVIVIHIS